MNCRSESVESHCAEEASADFVETTPFQFMSDVEQTLWSTRLSGTNLGNLWI